MATQPCLREFVHRGVTYKNRLGLAPLTRGRAGYPNGVPNELHVEYYTQRASGGFIISEVIFSFLYALLYFYFIYSFFFFFFFFSRPPESPGEVWVGLRPLVFTPTSKSRDGRK